MCGIVGYAGPRPCAEILLEGLRRLEYRGYDSAGLAVFSGPSVGIRKSEGKIANLSRLVASDPLDGTVGVGHTRWATHGRPSDTNAHPHKSGSVVVVHNGIIENHRLLKERLQAEGRVFVSETDTEVISHLLDREIASGASLEQAVLRAVKELEGSFAFLALSEAEPGRIVGARLNCPLVVGLGQGETFFASDLPPLLAHTREVVFLDDGEVAVVDGGGVRLLDFDGAPRSREPKHIDWSPVMAEKGGYRHFMLKEIFEQPRAILDTLAGRFSSSTGQVSLDELPVPADLRKVLVVACGTSWHAALVGKFMIESLARVPVEVDLGSEYRYRDPVVEPGTLCLAISQSGETADTLAGMREAKRKGAATAAVCNVVSSTIAREADGVLYTHAGPEIGVASTKAFTTQLVAMYLLALRLAASRGTLSPAEAEGHLRELAHLPALVEEALKSEPRVAEVARRYKDASDFLFLGRGISYPVALEGALKLKEISYIHAEGYPAGEMKHGPIALIDERMPVLVLCSRGEAYEKTLSNLEEAKSRGGRIVAVGTAGDDQLPGKAEEFLALPPCGRFVRPVVETVPLQLLAYHMAVLKGTDVDQPRNLAKSVTVE